MDENNEHRDAMLQWFDKLKAIAAKEKIKVSDLLALAPGNDPFYVGRESQVRDGEWAADVWERMGTPGEVHVRRMHYWLVTRKTERKPWPDPKTGMDVYLNTLDDWGKLVNATKYARYLGLIPFGSFIDRRNPEAKNWRATWSDEDIDDIKGRMDADSVLSHIAENGQLINPWPYMPYHMELWVEKSTMNDVLEPLCGKFGASLVCGLGELSITHAHGLVQRAQAYDVPVRIFYISDFDPAGEGMPISISRKIEYFQRMFADCSELDIRLKPIVLTAEQAEHFDLPRTPIKATDARKDDFELRHGAGATELDALEAIMPGKLKEIVSAEMRPYFDQKRWNAVRDANRQVHKIILGALDDIKPKLQDMFDEVDMEDVEAILESYDGDMPDPMNVSEKDDGWLYISTEDYIKALVRYKKHKAGDGGE